MTNISLDSADAAARKQCEDGSSFFVFLNYYRWLNWGLAVVLLIAKVAPPTPIAVTISVYLSVFIYNAVFTWRSRDIEKMLQKYPALIAVDILFCFSIVFVYGWRSPFTAYGFSPVMMAGFVFGMRGAFTVAALCAAGYGLSVTMRGPTLARIIAMDMLDQELFQVFDYFLVAIFFSYPASLAKKLRKSNKELVAAQDEIERLVLAKERRRLAGDIHDSAIQSLHGANMLLGVAIKESRGHAPEMVQHLDLVKEALNQTLAEIGTAVDDLFDDRLDERSFCCIAQKAMSSFKRKHQIESRFCATGCEIKLSSENKKALYLIIQEALSNVAKHSGARFVDININYGVDELTLAIKDDGCGFDVTDATRRGHGLDMLSMRARELGGTVKIDSNTGRGTAIVVTAPIPGEHCRACRDGHYFLAVKP